MTKIYFSYIFSLPPSFLVHSSKNPGNLLSAESDKCVYCYVNGVTLGKHLKMGLVASGAHHVIRASEHSVSPSSLQVRWHLAKVIKK